MADKYVIAAGGNWSAAGTWSLTDGGAGGAGAPSATENAFLSNQSGNLVQDTAAATCLDLDFTKGTGYAGTFSGSAALAVSGSLKLNGAMTRTFTGAINFQNNGTSKNITSNGVALSSNVSFIAGADTWTLQDAFNIGSGTLNMQASTTFNTNGKTVTTGAFLANSACTLTLGASVITCTSWTLAAACTFSGASSTISLGGSFGGGGKTYGTVTLNTTQSLSAVTGANTFGTLTLSAGAVALRQISIDSTQTVTGTFKYAGNSAVNRLWLTSDLIGTQRSISAAAVDATSNFTDFMDIAGGGAATPFATGTHLGDCGGNSGITTTPAATQTATGTASFTWSTHGWTTRVPLPQDDVIVPNAFVAGRTITMDMPRMGKNVTFSCTGSPIFSQTVQSTLFGSLAMGAGMTSPGAQNLFFGARSPVTLQSNGVVFAESLRSGGTVAGINNTITLLDAFSCTNSIVIGAANGFNDGGFSVTATSFTVLAATCSVTMNSTWTLTGNPTPWNNGSGCPMTIGSSSVLKFTDATATAKLFSGGGKTYNNVWFNNAGSGTFDISGSNTFNDFKVDAGRSVRFTAGTTNTAASWTVGAGCTIGSITAASHTLAKSGGGTVFVNSATISRSTATPGSTFYAISSTDGGNNSGWIFATIGAAQGQCSCSTVVLGHSRSPLADSAYEFTLPDKSVNFRVPKRDSMVPQ